MKRPKYLEDMDLVQDALKDVYPQGGLSLRELAKITNRNYAAMQQATVRLRNLDRIECIKLSRGLRFYYKE